MADDKLTIIEPKREAVQGSVVRDWPPKFDWTDVPEQLRRLATMIERGQIDAAIQAVEVVPAHRLPYMEVRMKLRPKI